MTNDFEGCKSALQYGDSYLVLKDVRLRCTFAPEDSGGIEGGGGAGLGMGGSGGGGLDVCVCTRNLDPPKW